MSEEKSQPNNRIYFPKQVITVFSADVRGDMKGEDNNDDKRYYVEIADVLDQGGKSFVGPGRPLTKETVKYLTEVVTEDKKLVLHAIEHLAPANLLLLDQRAGRQLIAWWTPEQKRTMFHEGKKSFIAKVPALVYVANHGTLKIAALNKNARPSMSTALFHAPFFNVYNDAKVCLGTVKAPKKIADLQQLVDNWEKSFWNSEFTNVVTGAYAKSQLEKWWRKKNNKKFPVNKLKQHKTFKTLKQLCQE